MISKRRFHVTITMAEPILGSQPNKNVKTIYIENISKLDEVPEDEAVSLPEALEKGTTGFHRDPNGNLLLFDYQVKGFLKASAQVNNGIVHGNIKALKSKVINYVFVFPRKIKLNLPEGGVLEYIERPLGAMTAQGPRVALARSEMLPVGTWFEVEIMLYSDVINSDVLTDILDYGALQGLGQWRSGGWGRFTYKMEEILPK